MLERDKVLNWWTGRISDQEMGEWTGMAPRAVGLVLNMPFMRSGITGGGRGSRHSRRVTPQTRNAVAIVRAMSEAGLSLETATNIIGATPVIASLPTSVVDKEDLSRGVRPLALVDPKGGWLPTDVVPWHVWDRYVLLCHRVENLHPTEGEVLLMAPERFVPNERGTMVIERGPEYGTIEIKPLTGQPVYAGEIDPLGLYLASNSRPDTLPWADHHLLIVNGRWVFEKSPFGESETKRGEPEGWDIEPISMIEPDRKTVRTIGWGRDDAEQERARYHLENFESLLDVNVTLAIRKMKRRAYGLRVDS